MKDKRNIDELLRKQLDGYSSGLPAGDWQVVQQKLAESNRKKKDRMYLPFILFGALACFLWQQPYVDLRGLQGKSRQEQQNTPVTKEARQVDPTPGVTYEQAKPAVHEKTFQSKSYAYFSTPQEAIHTAVSNEEVFSPEEFSSPNTIPSAAFHAFAVEGISPFSPMAPKHTDSVARKPIPVPKAVKMPKSSLEFAVFYATGAPVVTSNDPKSPGTLMGGFDPARVSSGLSNANVFGFQVNWHKHFGQHWSLFTGLGYGKITYSGRYIQTWTDPDLTPSGLRTITIITADMPQWSRISLPIGVAWSPLKHNEFSIFANFTTHQAFGLSGQFPDYQFHAPEEQRKGFNSRQYSFAPGVNIPVYRSRIGSLNLAYAYERMLGDFYQSTYPVPGKPLVTIRQHLHVVRLSWNLPLN